MNLRSWINNVAMANLTKVIFGQSRRAGLLYRRPMMLNTARVSKLIVCFAGALLAGSLVIFAQTNYYNPNGTEYAVIGSLPGDQMFPDAAISTTGGFVVWQDNITDGSGWGISARRLDSTLSGTLGTFRVNQIGSNDQENPRLALLKNGGAAFVWQGGVEGFQHIYAQFLTPTNTFVSSTDLLVNTYTNHFQINPVVATLNNSNVVVVWGSYDEASSSSLQDVYGQIFSQSGQKIGGEFLVNQFTSYNQRTPSIAALAGGGFVVAWVSEQERLLAPNLGTNNVNNGPMVTASAIATPSVDIYARLYTSSGVPVGNEFLVNTDSNPCANPSVAAAIDSSFLVAWSANDSVNPTNSWDVYARPFSSAGVGGPAVRVNTHITGDQYAPRIASIGLDYMVTWTSMGQDGSREGVFGQFVHEDGSLTGGEFQVNTTFIGQQMQPVVAADGVNQFLAVWTGYTGGANSFDLYAQRYVNASAVLSAMAAPFVWAPFVVSNNVYQPQLVVTWPNLLGISVSNFEVYVDAAASPTALVTSNQWTMKAVNGLTTNSTHSFQLDYTTTDGRRSPISPSASGTTWNGLNWYGIPYEWMAQFFGGYYSGHYTTTYWPSPNAPLVAGGPSLLNVFVSGGNPLDSTTWLKQTLSRTSEGLFLNWNTQPGATYQVQMTTNFTAWLNVGSPRFAAGTSDSLFVGGNPVGYYRLVLLR
jgi:hypothetical protein